MITIIIFLWTKKVFYFIYLHFALNRSYKDGVMFCPLVCYIEWIFYLVSGSWLILFFQFLNLWNTLYRKKKCSLYIIPSVPPPPLPSDHIDALARYVIEKIRLIPSVLYLSNVFMLNCKGLISVISINACKMGNHKLPPTLNKNSFFILNFIFKNKLLLEKFQTEWKWNLTID